MKQNNGVEGREFWDGATKFDLAVIGGGSGAFAAAIKGSEMGAKVAIIEEGVIGGTCLNRGCVPTKHLIRAAEVYHLAQSNPFAGFSLKRSKLDFAKLIEKKDALLDWARNAKYWDILRYHKNISFISRRAKLTAPGRIDAGGTEIQAQKIIIATGSSAFIPPIEGLDKVPYLTSTEALNLKELPGSMMVLGANAVGLELAQMFSRFGVKTAIHEIMGRVAPLEEPEISDALGKYIKEDGIEVCTCSKVVKARKEGTQIVISSEMPGGKIREFMAEALLVATGRRPNTRNMGLEGLGVAMDARGYIKTDEMMKTSVAGVFAAGDCVGPYQFVYTAAYQGAVAAQNALEDCCERKINYEQVPYAIFTDPEVASVGLKEEQARKRGLAVRTSILDFHWVPRAEAMLNERGLIKIVAEEKSLKLLGVHIVAPQAGELIHEAAMALKFGATAADLIDALHVYPTLSEALKICAQGFFKDATKLSCCAE
ncbi:MAG: mercury(II) reductase [Elusimicrobia bacterium]|nr:mercury(II) reductase [Elusimicrobiota bacterium]